MGLLQSERMAVCIEPCKDWRREIMKGMAQDNAGGKAAAPAAPVAANTMGAPQLTDNAGVCIPCKPFLLVSHQVGSNPEVHQLSPYLAGQQPCFSSETSAVAAQTPADVSEARGQPAADAHQQQHQQQQGVTGEQALQHLLQSGCDVGAPAPLHSQPLHVQERAVREGWVQAVLACAASGSGSQALVAPWAVPGGAQDDRAWPPVSVLSARLTAALHTPQQAGGRPPRAGGGSAGPAQLLHGSGEGGSGQGDSGPSSGVAAGPGIASQAAVAAAAHSARHGCPFMPPPAPNTSTWGGDFKEPAVLNPGDCVWRLRIGLVPGVVPGYAGRGTPPDEEDESRSKWQSDLATVLSWLLPHCGAGITAAAHAQAQGAYVQAGGEGEGGEQQGQMGSGGDGAEGQMGGEASAATLPKAQASLELAALESGGAAAVTEADPVNGGAVNSPSAGNTSINGGSGGGGGGTTVANGCVAIEAVPQLCDPLASTPLPIPAGAFEASQLYTAIKPRGDEPQFTADPPELRPLLRPYQRRAVAWMLQRERCPPALANVEQVQGSPAPQGGQFDQGGVPGEGGESGGAVLHPLWRRVVTLDGDCFYFNPYTGGLRGGKVRVVR